MWGRQRREEVLLDVEDVAAGHRTRMVWNDEEDWVQASEPTHQPIVGLELYERARARRHSRTRADRRKPRSARRPYVLRGLIHCGLCSRRTQGTWNHDYVYYRCRYPSEYALPPESHHPSTVYVREGDILPALDQWLARLFSPERVEATCEMLAASQASSVEDEARLATARRKLVDCDARLARHRAAIEAGVDPSIVADWIRKVEADRAAAERALRRNRTAAFWSPEDIRALVESLEDLVGVLGAAEPQKKAELYGELGLTLTYEPTGRRILTEADLSRCAQDRVGGGI